MNITFKIELGTQVREKISGFVGIVTANVVYLNGCKQCLVRPRVNKDEPHKVPEGHWFDEEYLEPVREGSSVRVEPRNTGSDTPAPSRPSHG